MAHRSQVEGIESKAILSRQSRTHARLRWSTRRRFLFDGTGSGEMLLLVSLPLPPGCSALNGAPKGLVSCNRSRGIHFPSRGIGK
jgi:hypothetical protein